MNTIDTVLGFIRQNNLTKPGDCIVCGLSGGADSCAMVKLLSLLYEELGISLVCAHLHHGLRGKEADRDMLFAESFANELGLPFFGKRVSIPSVASSLGISEEDAGRRERYAFFNEVARLCGANKIATAHNKDDNAETILMHLVRSSGIKGICGILPKRENVIRPILCLSRSEIEAFCRNNGINYVTDSTNSESDYTRNKFRLEIIPLLEQVNPSVKNALCKLGCSALTIQSFLDSCVQNLPLSFTQNEAEISREVLSSLHPAMIPEVLRAILKRISPETQLSSNAVMLFEKLAAEDKSTGRVQLYGNITARLSYDKIIISNFEKIPKFEYTLTANRELLLYGKRIYVSDTVPQNAAAVPWDASEPVTVRNRRPGDKMKIRGLSRKLQDMFVNMKIDRVFRDKLLIITFGDTIVWTEKIGLDDCVAHTKAKKYIIITPEDVANEKQY